MAEEKLVTVTRWRDEPVRLPVGSHCNILQYRLLKRCSDRKDTSLWNWYRERYPEQTIELVGADLSRGQLQHANLSHANLQHAELMYAKLQHAGFTRAKLQYSSFFKATLRHAHFCMAKLQFTSFGGAKLQHADFIMANLQHASLYRAKLHETGFAFTHLAGARMYYCIMRDARFSGNKLDTQTDFTGSNIHEALMTPQLESQLQCNMRRIHWRKETAWKRTAWSKRGVGKRGDEQMKWWERITWTFLWVRALIWQCIRWLCFCKPTRFFWWASDYGTSSKRLLAVFFSLAVGFAVLYGCLPETVLGLESMKIDGVEKPVPVEGGLLALRSFYFSVVTMTTLGFGDIHANPLSGWGHVFLMTQVLMGYFLLGALITRFGIMFTTNAPCPKIPRAKIDKWYYPLQRTWGWTRWILAACCILPIAVFLFRLAFDAVLVMAKTR